MMDLNRTSDMNITKKTSTIISTIFMMSVLVVGNQTITIKGHEVPMVPGQNVVDEDGKTNIYKTNINDDYMFLDLTGYITDNYRVETDGLMIDEEKMYNLRKLEQIASLPDNWNENGANAFSEHLIATVRNLVIFLDVQPEIFPTACDTLQLEYDKEDGAHLEIEISEDESAEVFLVSHTGEEELKYVQANIEAINKVVREFYG